jgi:hypothetical protein
MPTISNGQLSNACLVFIHAVGAAGLDRLNASQVRIHLPMEAALLCAHRYQSRLPGKLH